jgi:multidrug efflux pump
MTDQDPKPGFNLSRWALEHPALTRYLMVVLMLLGLAAYFQLGQDEDPPFTFRAMVMRTNWPGATAQQVAEQVTDKLERTLQEVPYADKIRSYSKPGESQIIFQIKDSSRPGDVANVWYTVRKKIGDIRGTLPAGIQGPFFNDDFGDVYGVIYALEADGGFSYAELKAFADDVRQQLLRVPDVAKVELFGVQDEKLYVEISQKRLAQLGLDLNQVLGQLGQQNASSPPARCRRRWTWCRCAWRASSRPSTSSPTMPIRGTSGSQLRLGDIAEIRRGYVDPPQVKVHHGGKEVVALGVSMAKGGDIIRLGQSLKTAFHRIEDGLPAGVRLVQVQDQPRAVATSVNEFVRTLVEAIVIVLAVSFIALGFHKRPDAAALPLWKRYYIDIRPGLVVGITIPLVLAVTFLAMDYWGIGLHKISLGSLIIALGLLVDDAIIAVEMMVRKMEEGYDKVRAATFAYEVTAMPMLTGTLITAAGFLPIGMAKSTVGEYTYAIFAVTVIALVISWLCSVYFVPYLGTLILKAKPVTRRAPRALRHAVLPPLPRAGELVRGAPLADDRRHHAGVRARHRRHGQGAAAVLPRFEPAGDPGRHLVPRGHVVRRQRGRLAPRGAAPAEGAGRHSGQHLGGLGRAALLPAAGPGVPADQRVAIHHPAAGPEAARVAARAASRAAGHRVPGSARARQAAAQRAAGALPGAVPRGGAGPARPARPRRPGEGGDAPEPEHARRQRQLERVGEGAAPRGRPGQGARARRHQPVDRAGLAHHPGRHAGRPVPRRRQADRHRAAPAAGRAQRHHRHRQRLPADRLGQVDPADADRQAGVQLGAGRDVAREPRLRHHRAGDIVEGLQGATVTAELLPALKKLEAGWPQGYRIEVAGAVEESSKGTSSISAGVPIMLFITFTLLMLQLHSFSRAMLVFITGPLGIAGVAGALLLLNRPFGFVALLGVIALMGMIQRNSVILIDQIEQDRARGVPAWDAIVESAVRRLRPIVLTAAAAVLAMIPLSRSVFWGPMAVAIMGGLVVATVLTLLALPAMYAAWFRVRRDEVPPVQPAGAVAVPA